MGKGQGLDERDGGKHLPQRRGKQGENFGNHKGDDASIGDTTLPRLIYLPGEFAIGPVQKAMTLQELRDYTVHFATRPKISGMYNSSLIFARGAAKQKQVIRTQAYCHWTWEQC